MEKKSGFKGKRPRKKFGRYGNRGGDRKINQFHLNHEGGAPQAIDVEQEQEPIIDLTAGAYAARRKATKSEIEDRLRMTSNELMHEKRKKEAAQLENEFLSKKNKKSKMDCANLGNIVRETRAENRNLKTALSNTERSAKILENRLVAQAWEHGCALDHIDKVNDVKLTDQQNFHVMEARQKEVEMRALVKTRDKAIARLEKKHIVDGAVMERQCNKAIRNNSLMHEKLLADIQRDNHIKLCDANERVEGVIKNMQLLKQRNTLLFEQERARHKQSLKNLQKAHALRIQRKNSDLKKMSDEVYGMGEMMYEMIDEVKHARRSDKAASVTTIAAQNRVMLLIKKVRTMTELCNDLKDEIADEYNQSAELQMKVDEYEVIIDSMQKEYEEKVAEYDSIVAYMDSYYEDKLSAHAEWLPEVDKLILEMLANRTPPTCIQANIYAMAKVLHPNFDVVKELPSVKHIKNLRTVLLHITKSLAAFRLGNAKMWNQLHTDETSRRQVSIVNVVVSILESDNQLKTICVSGSIIPLDGTAEEQSRAIIGSFHESGKLLKAWRDMTAKMYPDDPELVDLIPQPDQLSPTKLLGGFISHDNCATANLTGAIVAEKIIKAGRHAGLSDEELVLYQGHCFHHLWNTWFEAIEKFLSKKLQSDLKDDFDEFPSHLRVAKDIGELLRQVDKEYSFTANYAKGSGADYSDWKQRYRPGKRYLPPIRVLGGNRQDSSFEGALPVYDGRADMLMFTNECLYSSDNLLQRSLFIALGSMEVIAVLRVASILHLAVIIPLRWLTANTHTLAECQWGERSMGRAIQMLYDASVSIQADGSLLLDHDFIMNIFSSLYPELPAFKEYMEYHLEEKEGNVIGSHNAEERVLAIDEAMAELFWPERMENRQTTEYCYELAVGVSTTLLTELTDPKKSTHKYINNGVLAYKNLNQNEKEASLGKRANNHDPSEGNFATFTDVLCGGGCISIGSAAGIGQARYNKDMHRNHQQLVTGRKSNKNSSAKELELGIFHCIPEQLQNSLLASGKINGKRDRKRFETSLREQRSQRAKKIEAGIMKQFEDAEQELISISYLHQQYSSPRCWKTVKQALDEYDKLGSQTDRLKYVKEQILIRYLGLGWVNAHHPWSKNKYQFLPSELLKHLCAVVIPLQDTEEVPIQAPIKLPSRKDTYTLGTIAADLIALDKSALKKEDSIRLKAMMERDRLENSGFGDQLMELQQTSWAIEKIRCGSFKLDMCFLYNDDNNDILQWCQGTIIKIVKEKETFVIVAVKWEEECLKPGDMKVTTERLKKSKWNPTTHEHGSWRENLHHLTKTTDNI